MRSPAALMTTLAGTTDGLIFRLPLSEVRLPGLR